MFTASLARAVPGLGMSLGAVRLHGQFYRDPDAAPGASREAMLSIGVDDFRLANDPTAGYVHTDFVAVKQLSISLAVDLKRVGLGATKGCFNVTLQL